MIHIEVFKVTLTGRYKRLLERDPGRYKELFVCQDNFYILLRDFCFMCRYGLINSLKMTISGAYLCPGATRELEGQVLAMPLLGYVTLV